MSGPIVNDTTIMDAASPMMEPVNTATAALLEACWALSLKLAQPGDQAGDHRKNMVATALQGIVRQGHAQGVTDEDLYSALAVAVGWFLQRQSLSADHAFVLSRFTKSALLAVALAEGASQTGFPTQGRA